MDTSGTKLTYDDYVRIPDDDLRHEILDGEHVVSASPGLPHQQVAGRIYRQLWPAIEGAGHGRVFIAPLDVLLSFTDVLVPDVVIVLNRNDRALDDPRFVRGAPDLVVEVLSKSTSSRDRGKKHEIYARCGVHEYWIVDPIALLIEQFVLRDGGLESVGGPVRIVEFQGLPGVCVDLALA